MFQCRICGNDYPLTQEYFSKKSSNSTGYKFKCKKCEKEPPYYDYQTAVNIVDQFINNNGFYPHDFWSRVLNLKEVVKTLIYKEYGDNFISSFDFNFIDKYKLRHTYNKFKNLFAFIDYIYPCEFVPWQLNYVENGFWKRKENRDWACEWFINQLFEDKIIEQLDDLPKKISIKLIKNYGLGTLLWKYFNVSPFLFVNYIFPNKFTEMDFSRPPLHFYENEQKRKEILECFVNQLFESNIITDINQLPKVVSIKLFKKFNLNRFLASCFKNSSYNAINFLYPDRWKPWEFKQVPMKFWKNKNNVKLALEWFVDKMKEENIINDIGDLPKIPITILITEYGLRSLLFLHDCNINTLFSNNFPEIFNENSFGIFASDGTKLQSKEEVVVHEWLINNFNNVHYIGANHKNTDHKWYNSKYKEKYIPDWIVENKIIVEYFGLYNDKPNQKKSKMIVNYNKKTLRKIVFFSNLKDYFFVPLFREDFKNDIEGLNVKFKNFSTSKIKEVG